jgi:hypothetical protein
MRLEGRVAKEVIMPLIQVKLIENVFTAEQKQQIVRELTDAMVAIEGENMRPVTWCPKLAVPTRAAAVSIATQQGLL